MRSPERGAGLKPAPTGSAFIEVKRPSGRHRPSASCRGRARRSPRARRTRRPARPHSRDPAGAPGRPRCGRSGRSGGRGGDLGRSGPLAPAGPVNEGQPLTINGVLTPPTDNPIDITITWGDGTSSVVTGVTGSGFTATHTYTDDNPTFTSFDVYTVAASSPSATVTSISRVPSAGRSTSTCPVSHRWTTAPPSSLAGPRLLQWLTSCCA